MDMAHAREVAAEAVKAAGELLLDNLKKIKSVSYKAKSDIVTNVDLASEKLLIERIKQEFPEHNIVSEEMGHATADSEYTWIIDPIDGTINYFHGSSPFRVVLCLAKGSQPLLSVMYNPVKHDLYVAEKGTGATLNGAPLSVNKNAELAYSIVMTHISSKKTPRARTILALETVFKNSLHMRVFGSGSAAACYIASGKFDVYFNISTSPWDIVPAALLVEESGGAATDITGKPLTLQSTSILATNGNVHSQILELLEDV